MSRPLPPAPQFLGRFPHVLLRILCVSAVILLAAASGSAEDVPLRVGVAKVDVTPDFPVRLSGYFARKSESDGAAQKLYARALAIGSGADDACVLVTLDNLAIPASLSERVAAALREKARLPRERLAISATHTHCAPCLRDAAVNIFGRPFTPAEREHVDRYTDLVAERIESAALDALKDLRPANVEWGQGSAGFAANRRTKDGPVDRAMPLLVARDPASGKPRALLVNYACHCTTLGPEINKTSGDWAGFAADALERDNAGAGAVALVAIGCGADANPAPRGTIEMARSHGEAIAAESARLLATAGALRPLTATPHAQLKSILLAYDNVPTKEQWQKLAERTDPVGANARLQLARLERGERIDAGLPYTVGSWVFGDQLAMVFLSGEVVVDYSLRLKQDFDPRRLWINAYSNDVACYIPSRRILAEGGYEAEGAMTYYARPARLAPAVEDDIIGAVHAVVPASYATPR